MTTSTPAIYRKRLMWRRLFVAVGLIAVLGYCWYWWENICLTNEEMALVGTWASDDSQSVTFFPDHTAVIRMRSRLNHRSWKARGDMLILWERPTLGELESRVGKLLRGENPLRFDSGSREINIYSLTDEWMVLDRVSFRRVPESEVPTDGTE